ncbi:unnamed protein product [Somion occarium]|uniref:Uncharacterized protein n=1 Tax=Somion occarium TaxID=3059160 RepID=A0ABP1CZT7_9APHY
MVPRTRGCRFPSWIFLCVAECNKLARVKLHERTIQPSTQIQYDEDCLCLSELHVRSITSSVLYVVLRFFAGGCPTDPWVVGGISPDPILKTDVPPTLPYGVTIPVGTCAAGGRAKLLGPGTEQQQYSTQLVVAYSEGRGERSRPFGPEVMW